MLDALPENFNYTMLLCYQRKYFDILKWYGTTVKLRIITKIKFKYSKEAI